MVRIDDKEYSMWDDRWGLMEQHFTPIEFVNRFKGIPLTHALIMNYFRDDKKSDQGKVRYIGNNIIYTDTSVIIYNNETVEFMEPKDIFNKPVISEVLNSPLDPSSFDYSYFVDNTLLIGEKYSTIQGYNYSNYALFSILSNIGLEPVRDFDYTSQGISTHIGKKYINLQGPLITIKEVPAIVECLKRKLEV